MISGVAQISGVDNNFEDYGYEDITPEMLLELYEIEQAAQVEDLHTENSAYTQLAHTSQIEMTSVPYPAIASKQPAKTEVAKNRLTSQQLNEAAKISDSHKSKSIWIKDIYVS